MKRSATLTFAILSVFASAQFRSDVQPVPSELKKGFENINVKDGKKFLGYLAGPECEGRGTGEPGYDKAVAYVAAHFKSLGLKSVLPDGSFTQFNDFWRTRVDPSSLQISVAGKPIPSASIGVIQSGTFTSSGTGAILALSSSAGAISDEIKASIRGKVVFLVASNLSRSNRTAIFTEAAAVIRVDSTVSVPGWTGRQSEPSAGSVGRLSVTRDALETALGRPIYVPRAIDALVTEIGTVSASAKSETQKIKVANVVAKLEGSDPVLRDEFIGVGAHLDHLGKRGDTIYYGADDDGSGSTALMQLASALVANPVKPKRSTIFMAFYGEEMGLLGSRYITDNPPFDLTKMIAELQMDMVGRNSSGAQNGDQKRIDKAEENVDTIRLVGSKRISTRLDSIIQEENKHIGFRFKYDAEDVYTRSDHYMFARKGIPIAFYFSGFHPDYHQPTDTIEKINFEKIANTAKLNYLVIHRLGNEPGPLPKR